MNDTRGECHHGCTAVFGTIEKLTCPFDIQITATSPVHTNWKSLPEFVEAFKAADLVLVNGEGSMHHSRAAVDDLLDMGEQAARLGKASALINTTWQANSLEQTNKLRNFSMVSVREGASARELASAGIKARIVPDFALFHSPESCEQRSGIGYSDCVVGPVALQLHKRMREAGATPIPIFSKQASTSDFLRAVRHYISDGSSLRFTDTLDAARSALLDNKFRHSDYDTFRTAIASKKLIVTGRFHMMIFAMASQTPCLVVDSNTHKNRATLEDSGLGLWRSVRVDDITPELLERASRWEGDEAEHLEAFVSKGRSEMITLFADLAALVK